MFLHVACLLNAKTTRIYPYIAYAQGVVRTLLLFTLVICTCGVVHAAETEGIALLQTEPYDLVVVTDAAGGGEVKVELFNRADVVPPKTQGVLIVQPLSRPGESFEISWRDVAKIELWEERLKQQAEQRIAAKDFDGAFPFVAVLIRDYPKTPGLAEMRTQLVFQNALTAFQSGDLVRTLALLEELRRFNPRFNADRVASAISLVTDRMLQSMLDKGELELAQLMLKRLEAGYTADQIASIPTWKKKFRTMAEEKRDAALAAKNSGNFRGARQFALEMLHIDPTIDNGTELLREIDLAYPMVRVGVMQKAVDFDPTRIENSAARRAGRLVYRSMFEMLGASSEGGQYLCPFGTCEVSQDQQSFRIFVQPNQLPPPFDVVDSYSLADFLLKRANPEHALYNPAWAGLLREVSVPRPGEVTAALRRPHVLPQAMLQVRLDQTSLGLGDPQSITGSYQFEAGEAGGVVFRFAGPGAPAATQPREVYEVTMNSGKQAVAALLRREVDILDQLFPADAMDLRRQGKVRVENYPLPTLHVLVPWSEHPFVKDRVTKRGLLLATNRQEILESNLTGGETIPGCQVISGPMPAGLDQDDPLGYAYDRSILPHGYQPRLGALLIELRKKQWSADAAKKKEPEPTYKPLRIAHPANEIARVACEAIAQQLTAIKQEVQLIELPEGITQPDRDSCDLVYMVVAMWEPAVDARRLLGPDGIAASNDQMVGLGLRQLEAARNWKEVRDRLFELHRISHSELPVLPLYQLQESFAYQRELVNVGTGIVSIYQQIAKWRVNR